MGDTALERETGSQYLSTGKLAQKLEQTLENHRGERHIVVIQDFPDPDALSSAWAYQLIAQPYEIECDIVYAGTLSHQENIALVKLTGVPTPSKIGISPFIKGVR